MSAFEINNKTGRLTITDSEQFIKILAAEDENHNNQDVLDHFEALKKYGFKQLHNSATDIPYGEYEYIINFAIAKTVKDFDPAFNTNLLSFFFDKLRGELSAYRSKRDTLQEKVFKVMRENEGGIDYVYQKDSSTEENYVVPVESQSPEDKLLETDLYQRKMKALKMAFSGIPRELQFILHEIGNGKKIKDIAELTNSTNFEVSRKRNQGLSLILQRVMRSKHLTEDEKVELAELHDIHYEENVDFEDNLK